MVKNLLVTQESQETPVQPLGRENPLEEGMASHSSVLAWRIAWTEEPGRLHPPHGRKELGTAEATEYRQCLKLKVSVSCRSSSIILFFH